MVTACIGIRCVGFQHRRRRSFRLVQVCNFKILINIRAHTDRAKERERVIQKLETTPLARAEAAERIFIMYRVTQKTATFEKPNKN